MCPVSNPVPIIFTNGIRLVMKPSVSDPPGILYLLISTCSSVIVGPQKTLSICDLGGCLGNLSPVTLINIYINLIGFLKPSYFFIQYEEVWLYRSE